MLKAGDIVVCIDTYGVSETCKLIKYNKYKISSVYLSTSYSGDSIRLEGIVGACYISRFISLSKYRKQKLNKICLK